MTNDEIKNEISQHLNETTQDKRKHVLEDVEYILAMNDGDVPAAFKRAYGIIYGSAKNMRDMRRQMKKSERLNGLVNFAKPSSTI